MDEYFIECFECGEHTTITADSIPEYCPMCGRRCEAQNRMVDEDKLYYDTE